MKNKPVIYTDMADGVRVYKLRFLKNAIDTNGVGPLPAHAIYPWAETGGEGVYVGTPKKEKDD